MRLIALLAGLSSFSTSTWAGAAAPGDCMSTFYQTKQASCLDNVLTSLRPVGSMMPPPHSIPDGAVGFFTEVFRTNPVQRERLLAAETAPSIQSLFIIALARGGLQDEANSYATDHHLDQGFQAYQARHLPVVTALHSDSNPGDNDFLIGAYMASGDAQYIRAILVNFSTADDAMVHDALRLGLVQEKFGSKPPPGRQTLMAVSACRKYACRADPQRFMRVMTLSTASWALRSLSAHDPLIKSTLAGYFARDVRLQRIAAIEENAFANYLTFLALFAGIKDNSGVNASLAIYETLGSADDAMAAATKGLRATPQQQ